MPAVRLGAWSLWAFRAAAFAQHRCIPPLLILHGERDVRVPVAQAWGFQRVVDDAGLPFTLITYPREGYVLCKGRHSADASHWILQFLRARLSR